MGRWTRRLAPLLIEFGGLADGEHVLDVGCGTGSLSYALSEAAHLAAATGIDQAEVYLDYARRRSTTTANEAAVIMAFGAVHLT